MVDCRNSLPNEFVSCTSLSKLNNFIKKLNLDKFLKGRGDFIIPAPSLYYVSVFYLCKAFYLLCSTNSIKYYLILSNYVQSEFYSFFQPIKKNFE